MLDADSHKIAWRAKSRCLMAVKRKRTLPMIEPRLGEKKCANLVP
jgi:hypothetical protein